MALYIRKCLESVAAQTYTGSMECLIVDDCGPDNSVQIAEEFIREYVGPIDFRIIHREQNGGLSAARNSGIREAKGEYLYFLDSDDMVFPHAISTLVALAEKYPGIDMVQGKCEVEVHNNYMEDIVCFNKDRWNDGLYKNGIEKGDNLLLQPLFPATAWNKLVRRDVIINNDLYFMEGILHEDDHWRWKINRFVKTIVFCHEFTYWYRVNNNTSIMRNPDKTRSFLSHLKIYRDIALHQNSTLEQEFALRVMSLDYKRVYWSTVKQKDMVLSEISKVISELKQKKVPFLLKLHLYCNKLPNMILQNRVFQILYGKFTSILLR